MSGTTQNWSIPTTAAEHFQQSEKRLGWEERRPTVRKASDLLGPGYAPYAVPLADPNSEEAGFNGLWHLPVGAPNSPDDTKNWLGQTIATAADGGVQVFWTYETGDAPHVEMMRSFQIGGGTRFYTPWQDMAGGGGGGPSGVQAGVKNLDPVTTSVPVSGSVVFATPFAAPPIIVTGVVDGTTSSRELQTTHDAVTVNGFTLWFTNRTNASARDCTWMATPATQ